MELSRLIKKKVLIVSHDAGAANQIYYYIKTRPPQKYFFFLKGPAKKIFNKKNSYNSLITAIKRSDCIITGTGWQSNLEYNAIQHSSKYKKKTISFVDEGLNLKIRFLRNRKLFLPDVLIAKDAYTFKRLKSFIPITKKIIQTQDFFLKYVRQRKIKPKSNKIIYFSSNYNGIAEKLNKNKNKINYDISLLKIFLEKIKKINKFKNCKIYLRLHPSENITKYKNSKLFRSFKIKISKEKNIINCLKKFHFAFGCGTYALVISKYFGLETFNNVKNINYSFINKNFSNNYKIKKI